MANRFDGVDFTDDESRLLFIWNLPKTTNLQERFLTTRLGTTRLFAERIRTRIIQAVGRCSRNPSDYSIVCVMGDTIQNDLTKHEKNKMFAPELRAEIQFGLENSKDYQDVDEIVEQAKDFLDRNDTWQEAENNIVEVRNSYWNENDANEGHVYKILHETSILELKYQYTVWKKDYKQAFELACTIVGNLNPPALNGYKCYWNYIAGCMAHRLFESGLLEYKAAGIKCFSDALKGNISIRWLSSLVEKLFAVETSDIMNDDYFYDSIELIEQFFLEAPTMMKLERKIRGILDNLQSTDGKAFERGHKELGKVLGYISENPDSTGAPEPYWIINENNIVVSEDKIYDEKDVIKSIPISDVSEAVRHRPWIIEHEKRITKQANIYTIFITNSKNIEEEARIYSEGVYYIHREEYVEWAVKALTVLRNIYNLFVEEGNAEWREVAHQEFCKAKITPKDYLDFVCKKNLKDI